MNKLVKSVHYKIYHFSLMILLATIFLNVFMVDQELYDHTRTGKWLFVLQYLPVLVLLTTPVFIGQMKQRWEWLSFTLVVFSAWMMYVGRPGGIWDSEKFLYWACGISFFWIVKYAITFYKKNELKWATVWVPILVICIIGLIEAVLGQLQILNRFKIYHSIYRVTGTFFNPAPFAGFIVACLPYSLLMANPKSSTRVWKILSWIGIVAAMMMIVILPATQSRAAWIALVVAIGYFGFHHFNVGEKVSAFKAGHSALFRGLIAGALVLTLVAGYGLYQFKKDSADGRLLIWKVAKNIMMENPLTGTGYDTFQAHFAPGLAQYFQSGGASKTEEMLAGNVQWAFNQPLQFGVELGVPGMMLYLTVIALALLLPLSPSMPPEARQWVYTARASVLGLFVFGLFSYPFHSPAIVLLFFFALSVIAAHLKPIKPIVILSFSKNGNWSSQEDVALRQAQGDMSKENGVRGNIMMSLPDGQAGLSKHDIFPIVSNSFILLLISGFACYGFTQSSKLKQAYWLWDEAKSLYQIKAYEAANESFEEAKPILATNGLFMQQYGKSLQMAEKYEKAKEVLAQSGQYYKDDFWYITNGDICKELEDVEKAEWYYQQASDMVPHKLYPKYLLAMMYDANSHVYREKAQIMAQDILTSEVKVMSTAVEEIQQAMRDILSKSMVKKDGNKLEPEAEPNNSKASGSGVPPNKGKEVQR